MSRKSQKGASTFSTGPMSSKTTSCSYDVEWHNVRVEAHRMRMETFVQQTVQLATFLSQADYLVTAPSVEVLAETHDITLEANETFTNATQSNIAGFSCLIRAHRTSNKRSLYAHALLLKSIPVEAQNQLINEALKVQKYFATRRPSASRMSQASSSSTHSVHSGPFLGVLEMFFIEPEQRVFVIEEKFSLENTLQHRIWGTTWIGNHRAPIVKQWAIQLASAIELLNQAGVANRFIRAETVLLSRNHHERIQLASFDFACLYWNAENNAIAPIRSRGLPLPLASHLLDHLPPECFATLGYDASMVDVWSLGTIICHLLTGSTPFIAPNLLNASAVPVPDYVASWKRSEERRVVPEEIRSLLDDIFIEADRRITVWEVANDFRLVCKDTREFMKKKLLPYYRIDLIKNININGPEERFRNPKAIVEITSPLMFSANSTSIFNMESYQNIRLGGEAALANYRVLRSQSFTGDLGANIIVNDYYLKAVHFLEESPLTDPTVANCLVKIVPMRRIPISHRNMLLNESTKILRHFSAFEPLNSRIHRILDVYLLEDTYLYLFFESLAKHKSLYQLLHDLSADYLFPPPSRAANKARMLTLAKLQVWMRDLAQTVAYLAQHGLSHRYIRPEFVFIDEQDHSKSKLTHFDLACFAWNPDKSILIKRTRAIQDRLEHQWDHLPPEAYEQLYNCLKVDVWSIGVLFVFCLTKAMPFSSPISMEQASEQWAAFQRRHAQVFNPSLAPITEILSLIFVPEEERIKASELVIRLSPPLSLGDLAQPTRRRTSDCASLTKRMKSSNNSPAGKKSRAASIGCKRTSGKVTSCKVISAVGKTKTEPKLGKTSTKCQKKQTSKR